MNHSDFFIERRNACGLSQAKIGQLLGYSSQSIAAWESGRSFPDLVVWSKYASILGVDLEGFLLGTNQKKNELCNTIKFDSDKFSNNLRHLRKKNNLILSDLAKLISINVKTISAWEKGKSFPNLKTFLRLCALYECSYNELYFVIEENKPKATFKPIRKKRIFFPIILPIILATGAAGGGVTAAVINNQQKMASNNVAPKVENYYTVTWQNYDGTILEVDENVLEGTLPTYDGKLPLKDKDAQYTYIFDGWSPEVVEVKENATYTAYFKNVINSYSVRWENYDGSLLYEESYEYGDTPTYKGEEPTRESTTSYTYIFDGWSPEVVEVTENATYTAYFKNVINSYSVRWENYDGSLLYEESYEYGDTPTYKGEEPIRESTTSYTYIFDGWSPIIEVVHNNQVYKAKYITQAIPTYELINVGGKDVIEITGCDENATDLIIPSTIDGYDVIGIKSRAFKDNSVLKSVTISEGITYIDEEAFNNCSSLKSVALPDSLEEIKSGAFYNCTSLATINIPDKVTFLDGNVFTNCGSIPTENLTLYDNAYYIGSSVNPYLQLLRAKDKNITSCTIINNSMCKKIAESAFAGCNKLTSITLSDGITELDYCIFYDCPLKTIYISSTVKAISHGAFYGTELETIIADENNPYYKSVDGVLYTKDMSKLMVYPGRKVGSLYVVPEQTIEINEHAFPVDYPFTSMVMHSNFVKSNASITALTDIYYLGTIEQWENVTMADYTGNVHFYSEVEVVDPQDKSYWHYVDDVPTLW